MSEKIEHPELKALIAQIVRRNLTELELAQIDMRVIRIIIKENQKFKEAMLRGTTI